MRYIKKFKISISILTCAVLIEIIDAIKVPTDWSEILSPKRNLQQTPSYTNHQIVLANRNSRTNFLHNQQTPIIKYRTNLENVKTNYPSVYKTLPNLQSSKLLYSNSNNKYLVNYPKKSIYPKTVKKNYFQPNNLNNYRPLKQSVHLPNSQLSSQPYIWLQLDTINKHYNLAPILTTERPAVFFTTSQPEEASEESAESKVNHQQDVESEEEVEPEPKTFENQENVDNVDATEIIPDFAQKIYENDPFSRRNPQKFESRSSDSEEKEDDVEDDHDNIEVDEEGSDHKDIPQDETPYSEHEEPLDIPTKPIYPGEGQWARRGRKHKLFIRPDVSSKRREKQEERPDGYEIFEQGEKQFDQAATKFQDDLKHFPRKHGTSSQYEVDPQADGEETVYKSAEINFVPMKTYAQVRKSESTQHLPQSEAYKEAESHDELVNAPRLREVIKNTKAMTVYTEEGYEDEAYDHGGHEKKAENHENFKNHEDDTENLKDQHRRGNQGSQFDEGRKLIGSDDQVRSVYKDVKDLHEKHNYKDQKLVGGSAKGGSFYKFDVNKPQRAVKRTTKTIEETIVKNIEDDNVAVEMKPEVLATNDINNYKKNISIQIPIQTEETVTIFDPIAKLKINPEAFFDSFTEETRIQVSSDNNTNPERDPPKKVNEKEVNQIVPVDILKTSQKTDLKKRYQTKITKKVEISHVHESSRNPNPLTRVKRYDKDKLSKIYVRKRPHYYWEKSKNRGNTKIENLQKKSKHQENSTGDKTEGVTSKNLRPVNPKLSKYLLLKQRVRRSASRFKRLKSDRSQIDSNIEDVSKFSDNDPEPKADMTYIKYPYYLLAESGRINRYSPLKYAEDLTKIPLKTEGGMEFYESTASVKCPEVDPTIDPVPEHIKNKHVAEEDTATDGEEEDIDSKIRPLNQVQRLNNLGDKIDCMKVKYFGEDPLDNPFFKEEVIEPPSMDSVFPGSHGRLFKKQAIKANLKPDETRPEKYIQKIDKSNVENRLKTATDHRELANKVKLITDYLNDSVRQNKTRVVKKRDTTSSDESRSLYLDTIVVLNEEESPNNKNEVKKVVVVSKSDTNASKIVTTPVATTTEEEITTASNLNEIPQQKYIQYPTTTEQTTTEVIFQWLHPRHLETPKMNEVTTTETKILTSIPQGDNKVSDIVLSHMSTLEYDDFPASTFDSTLFTTEKPTTTTTLPPTTTVTISTLKPIPRRRLPSIAVIPKERTPRRRQDANEPKDFIIIIDTDGENLSDVPLKLPLVNDKEFAATFDINKYLPKLDLKAPLKEYDYGTKPFKKKIPTKVQMEVFADIVKHMKTSTEPVRSKETTDKSPHTRDQSTENQSSEREESSPGKRKIRIRNNSVKKRGRMKVTNSKIEPPGDETVYDMPASSTEHHYVKDPLPAASGSQVDINNPQLKYPGTFRTLFIRDQDNTERDVYTPEKDSYKNFPPEYSSDPDHEPIQYDHAPEVNPQNDDDSYAPLSENGNENTPFNSMEYDLVYNHFQNSYVLRPVKNGAFRQSPEFSSGFRPLPNYSPEFAPIHNPNMEQILVQGLKPVRYGNAIKLVIPHWKIGNSFISQRSNLYSVRPVRKLKPRRIIRLGVQPKKVIRVNINPPQHVHPINLAPLPAPNVGLPYQYHQFRSKTNQNVDYYNIEGMVPPLASEQVISYSAYLPVTFGGHSPNSVGNVDSFAVENTNHLNKKSFEDLQMESSDTLETVVDIHGRPVTQRKYKELDKVNRQANQYNKPEEVPSDAFPMEGEVLMLNERKDAVTEASSDAEEVTKSLRDSYGNIISKPSLEDYSSVVGEMESNSKRFMDEPHQPNMPNSKNSPTQNHQARRRKTHKNSPPIADDRPKQYSIDARRKEPRYENNRFRRPTKSDLPITNSRRRHLNNTSQPDHQPALTVLKAVTTVPDYFDVNPFIPDSNLKKQIRKQVGSQNRRSSSQTVEASENYPRYNYSSRFNADNTNLPLPTEKTLQKPVVLVIEQFARGPQESRQNSGISTIDTLRKNRYKSRKIENPKQVISDTNTEIPAPTTQRIISFRRNRPLSHSRKTTSASIVETTESGILKTNRPRKYFSKHSKNNNEDPIVEVQKEHLINRTRNSKIVRANQNNQNRQRLVVDPVELRHKARIEAEALENVKDKFESPIEDEETNTEETKPPSKNRHFEKSESLHKTSRIIHTKVYPSIPKPGHHSEEETQGTAENSRDEEKDETLNKDFSELVEIIGNLEQIRRGPKHGGNYRHIKDQKSDDTNHGDKVHNRNKKQPSDDDVGHLSDSHEEEEDDSSEIGDHHPFDFDRHLAESKPQSAKVENKKEGSSEETEYKVTTPKDDIVVNTSSFYNDRHLPVKINNLKHATEDPTLTGLYDANIPVDSDFLGSQIHTQHIKINNPNRPPAIWSKIIKDPSARQYFYARE